MATKSTDLPVPEIMEDAVAAALEGKKALWGNPAVIAHSSMPHGNTALGKTVEIPYFTSIGEFEEPAEGGALTPSKLSASTEEATVRRMGKAVGTHDWARYLGMKGDPYTEAARQLVEGFFHTLDKVALDATVAPLANYTVDVYNAATPRTIDSDLILDGQALWGDEADDDTSLMVCHSKVRGDIRKLKDATGRPLYVDPIEGKLGKFMGCSVGVSDRVTPTEDTPPKYTSALLKRGAIALWYNGAPSVEADRDILAGVSFMAIWVYFVCHRYTRLGPDSTKPGVALLKHN